jgi:N-acetylglucosamine kinase-like BadF-type ATPase
MNSIGIDVGKRKCRASIKDEQGKILDEFFAKLLIDWTRLISC